MKILHVNAFDMNNGAARAAYRLHEGLLNEGADSKILVQIKESSDPNILSDNSFIAKIINRLRWRISAIPKLFYLNKTELPFSTSWLPASGLVKKINALKPDIVHLHWIAGGMMQIKELSEINAPIVWTLHDNGPFTGGCHVMWDCKKYLSKCGQCPVLRSDCENDLSTKIFENKLKTYEKIANLNIVGVSEWISKAASSSTLLKDKRVVTIPNLIDTGIYAPKEKNYARQQLDLPLNKKLILFGALSAIKDINKGYQYLIKALKILDREDVELVVFGNSDSDLSTAFGFKINYLGYLDNDTDLCLAYSSADVMIVPSIQESFGQTAIESMACGTPVVSFDTTGLIDIVDHLKNGYRAKCFDEKDLSVGIEWVLNYANPDELKFKARQKIIENFDSKIVVNQFVEFYNSILQK